MEYQEALAQSDFPSGPEILSEVFLAAPIGMAIFSGPSSMPMASNVAWEQFCAEVECEAQLTEALVEAFQGQKECWLEVCGKEGKLYQLLLRPLAAAVGVFVFDKSFEHSQKVQLQKSKEQLEVILHGVADGITVVDASGRIIYANDEGAQMCGVQDAAALLNYSDTEILEKFELFAEDGQPIRRDLMPVRQALSGVRPEELMIQFRFKEDAQYRWALVNSTPIFNEDGEVLFAVNIFKDFTERKRAEELIKQREAQLSLITNALPVLVSYIDRNQRYVFVNKAYETWFDLPCEQYAGHSIREILGEEIYQIVYPNVASALKGREVSFEYVMPASHGRRYVRVQYIPDFGVDHEVRGIVVLVNDISELKRREKSMELLSEASAVLGSSLDYQETLNTVARLAVSSFGDWCVIDALDRKEGTPKQIAVAHWDSDKLTWAEEYRKTWPPRWDAKQGAPQVLRSGRSELYSFITDDQLKQAARDERHLKVIRELGMKSVMIVPLIARGRTLGTITFVSAESDRRYNEEDLKYAEELGRKAGIAMDNALLFQELQEPTLLKDESLTTLRTLNWVGQKISAELDLQNLVQMLTDAATKLTRAKFGAFFYNQTDEDGETYMLYSVAGASHEDFEKFPMPRKTAVFGPTFDGSGVVRSDDITLDPRYGKNAPFYGMPEGHLPVRSYMAVPVISRSGEVLGALFLGHPEKGVFDSKEEELGKGLAAQAAVAIDNAKLYSKAQEAIRVRDEFLSIASHELKTPLTPLKIQVQSLKRLLSPESFKTVSSERLDQLINTCDRQITRLSMLIDNLLDISRINGGKFILNKEQWCLDEALREILERHAPQLKAAACSVHFSSIPKIIGDWDRLRIEQVIVNLLTNAMKYAPGKPIEVSAGKSKDEAFFSISDQGPGIAKENQERIFERFERLKELQSVTGLGLGLFITRQIVDAHGGRINVSSLPGQGAKFTVYLPLKAA